LTSINYTGKIGICQAFFFDRTKFPKCAVTPLPVGREIAGVLPSLGRTTRRRGETARMSKRYEYKEVYGQEHTVFPPEIGCAALPDE